MFSVDQQLPDRTNDLIGAAIDKFNDLTSWTFEKKSRRAELERVLGLHGYVRFSGNWKRYHLQRIGQSCHYNVPTARRGHLQPFRGERVRLVCVGYEGQHERVLMVGVVPT